MRVSLNWLRDFVQLNMDTASLCERLTMGGLEVDAVEEVGAAIASVVVGEIVRMQPHPQADRLTVCQVRIGTGPAVPVVCGATNMKAGDRVAYAPPGTTLPGGRVEEREVRGVRSLGMLCSEAELELSGDASGLMILEREAPLGERIGVCLGIEDTVVDVAVPPNRGDCLSVLGIGRELAALAGLRVRRHRIGVRERGTPAADAIAVRIDDVSGCGRYAARVVRNLRIGASPRWMQQRLVAAGLRPINNVVDVTNYVMIERGQPLHAFDYARLPRPEIVVRRAGASASFETLDGVPRVLDPDDLLITTGEEPVAIAGVMGGAETEVSASTSVVLLESAWFEPSRVRRTARRLGLHSEAAFRFERGVDIGGVPAALDRAAALLERIAGGEVARGMVDAYPRVERPAPVHVRLQRVEEILGAPVTRGDVVRTMKALGASVSAAARGTLTVMPPTYRLDLSREIDVIEEVARVRGYERIAPTMPAVSLDGGVVPERMRRVGGLRRLLAAQGMDEAVILSFASPRLNECFRGIGVKPDPVLIVNPMSRDESQLRLSLVGGLVTAVRQNRSQGVSRVAVFSVGKVFWKDTGPQEGWRLAGVWAGEVPDQGLGGRRPAEFADIKGVVESVLDHLRLTDRTSWKPLLEVPAFHPGKSAAVMLADEFAGVAGCLHPDLEVEFEIEGANWFFELDLEKLLAYLPARAVFRELPRFPAVVRDLAIVTEEQFPSGRVIHFVRQWGHPLVETVVLFDQYVGAPIPPGMKGLAYSISYRAADRTLTDDEVNEAHAELTAALSTALPLELRR